MTKPTLGTMAVWLLAIIAVLLPCRYLLPLDAADHIDWLNHQWAIGYIGEWFRQHHAIPVALNTPQMSGMTIPVFYGNLGYPLLGIASSFTSAELAIRVAAVAVFAAQYALVVKAVRRLEAPAYFAHALACIVTWAIYPLTNLYSRGALMEFFATTLLVCAICLLVLLVRFADDGERHRYARGAMFCLTLSVGTHPITAMYSVPVLATFALLLWRASSGEVARRRAILLALWPWVALALVCLTPWLFAVVKLSPRLAISHHPAVTYFPDSIDHWITRFWPLPLDTRVTDGVALSRVSSPYLDAQISLPLLVAFGVVAIVLLVVRRGRVPRAWLVPVLPILGFAGFTWISFTPRAFAHLPEMAKMIQFGYRAVTYENLSLLLGVFLVLMAMSVAQRDWLGRKVIVGIVVACGALAFAGVVVKWSHIAATETYDGGEDAIQSADRRASLLQLPGTYYGGEAYAISTGVDELTADEAAHVVARDLELDAHAHFGSARPLSVTFAEPTWLRLNVLLFSWNTFTVDGNQLEPPAVRALDGRVAIRVPAGTHKIGYRMLPSLAWRVSRMLSLLGMLAWCLAMVPWWRLRRRVCQRRSPPVETRASGLPSA